MVGKPMATGRMCYEFNNTITYSLRNEKESVNG